MAGKVANIRPRPVSRGTADERTKVICTCGEDSPSYLFRLTVVGGKVEPECCDCLGDMEPYYTAEAVDAMIKAAVEAALAQREVATDAGHAD